MYSPYDSYIDKVQENLHTRESWSSKENYFMPGKIMAGIGLAGGGMALGGAGMIMTNAVHRNAMNNRPGYATAMNKLKNNPIYKGVRNPLSVFGYGLPIRKTNSMDAILNPWRGKNVGIPGIGELISRKIPYTRGLPGQGRYIARVPMMAPALFAFGALNGLKEENHPSGLALGVARTGAMLGGTSAGQMLGFALGSFAGPVGSLVGGLIGGAIGGTAGDQSLNVIKWMKSKGRQWTRPDLGGNFVDSQMGQTMRARSLNAIQTSQFNVRSNLGNEAVRLTMGY